MASLIGKVIDGWKVQGVVKSLPHEAILKVCSVTNEEDKYCMSIMYKDSKNPDELSNSIVTSYSSVNINVAPQYSYYDKHCFPIIPQHHVRGMYEGHPYFVYERIAKTLMDVITNRSLHVSQDDLVNIAVQLFEILHFLIVDGKVLKNLTVNDFILRRTTKGYRLVLLNQDFYDGSNSTPTDPTFASVSVMHNNAPTSTDNVISGVYIMLYLIHSTLPWQNDNANTMLLKKMDADLLATLCEPDWSVLATMLRMYSLHEDHPQRLADSIDALHRMSTTRNITFGTTLSKNAKQRRIPDRREEREENHEKVEKIAEKPAEKPVEKPAELVEPSENPVDKPAEPVEKPEEEAKPQEVNDAAPDTEPVPVSKETAAGTEPVESHVQPVEETAAPVEESAPARRSCKRDHGDGVDTDAKRGCTRTIESKAIRFDAKKYFSSATFTSLLMVAGILAADAVGK
ncbi:hypothetical protein WA588_003584 [Blastocystis sp. NMH]